MQNYSNFLVAIKYFHKYNIIKFCINKGVNNIILNKFEVKFNCYNYKYLEKLYYKNYYISLFL